MTDQVPIDGAQPSVDDAPRSVTYRLYLYRPIVLTTMAILGLIGVVMLINLPTLDDRRLIAFEVFWLAALAWNVYWSLFRVAYEVGIVDGSTLRWRSITTHREVPLLRVKAIKSWPPPFATGVKKVVVDGDLSPLIIVTAGFSDLIAMFNQVRPELTSQLGWYDRHRQVHPRSMFWRRL